jgi:hypothetical protein
MPRNGNRATGDGAAPERLHTNSNPPANSENRPLVQARPSYVLTLRPLPDCDNPIRQLRWALKTLRRRHGLECTNARVVQR